MTDDRHANTRGCGRWAEDIASRYLCNRGLRELRRNYLCPVGEIDIIMEDRACLVFVEVRYRKSDDYTHPAETVGRIKQRRLIRTASHYLQSHRGAARRVCRFDVVIVEGQAPDPTVEWISDAFRA